MDDIPEEDTGTPEVADVGGPASVEKAAANVASIADQTLLAVQQLGVGSNTNIQPSRWKKLSKLTLFSTHFLHICSFAQRKVRIVLYNSEREKAGWCHSTVFHPHFSPSRFC